TACLGLRVIDRLAPGLRTSKQEIESHSTFAFGSHSICGSLDVAQGDKMQVLPRIEYPSKQTMVVCKFHGRPSRTAWKDCVWRRAWHLVKTKCNNTLSCSNAPDAGSRSSIKSVV